jgi:hypothetical protein
MPATGAKRQKVVETMPETVTPAAERFARERGLSEYLLQAQSLVRRTNPSARALFVDLEEDWDNEDSPTIRFHITTDEPVERVLELNSTLEEAFCREMPARHRVYFSYTYRLG